VSEKLTNKEKSSENKQFGFHFKNSE